MAKDWFPPDWFPQTRQQQSGGSSTTPSTTTPSTAVTPTPAASRYEVHVDWNGDGDFGEDGEDITQDVLQMSWRRGRNRASQLVGKSVAGRAKIFLRSLEGKYFPSQTQSPLSGGILPARDMRILMAVTVDSLAEFDRPSKAWYIDINGYLRQVESEVLRDAHYVDDEKHILLERESENMVDAWNITGWNRSSATPTAQAAIHGIIPVTIEAPGGGYVYDSGLQATSDGKKAVSLCVKQGTSTGTVVRLRQSGGALKMDATVGPWTDGEPDVLVATGSGELINKIQLADGWWLLQFVTKSYQSGIAHDFRIYPNGVASNTVHRSIQVMAPQLEDQPMPTMPMDPADGSREADSFYVPFKHRPQALTIYTKFHDGTQDGERILQISESGNEDPRLYIARTADGYKIHHHNGTSSVESEVAEGELGKETEIRAILYADGAVQLYITIDDVTTASVKSAALSFDDMWSDQRLWLNSVGMSNIGSTAFQDVKVALGTARSLEKMQDLVIEGSDEIILLQQIMWYGQVDSIRPEPKYHKGHRLTLLALGPLKLLTERGVDIPFRIDQASGDVVEEILDQADWPAARRDVDSGQTQLPVFFTRRQQTSAFSALQEVEETEFGWVGETRNGGIFFQERHHRLSGTRLDTQVTFKDAYEVGVLRIHEPKQHDYLDNVYNLIRVPYQTFNATAQGVLWSHPGVVEDDDISIGVAGGDSFVVWAQYPGNSAIQGHIGVHTWTTPVAITDYKANSADDGSGSDRTSDLTVTAEKFVRSIKITVENTSTSEIYVTKLQVRGTPLVESDVLNVVREDSDSQVKYGVRDYPFPGEFVPSVFEAQDFADAILSIYKDPVPSVQIPWLASRDVNHLLAAARLDLSDRVTVQLTEASSLGLDEEMFIESEQHQVSQASREHRVVYEMSFATDFGGFWTLGSSAFGSDTKLGY